MLMGVANPEASADGWLARGKLLMGLIRPEPATQTDQSMHSRGTVGSAAW